MAKGKKKPKTIKPASRRNPFAGRPQSGAGFHSETKYGKKNRQKAKHELEDEIETEAEK